MTPEQVIKHYGSESNAAHALRISRQIINYWKQNKRIPQRTQAYIQVITNGALKANL